MCRRKDRKAQKEKKGQNTEWCRRRRKLYLTVYKNRRKDRKQKNAEMTQKGQKEK